MRKPRDLRESARYHVSARANRGEMIMADSAVKDLFLQVVARAKESGSFLGSWKPLDSISKFSDTSMRTLFAHN